MVIYISITIEETNVNILNLYGISVPSDNQNIARYFCRSKLERLLGTKEIWFANINTFPDKHERSIPDNFFVNWTDERKVNYLKINELKSNAIPAYISCWTKFDSENYALWKIYDPNNDGVCILTTVGKFKKLIKREDMFMCEVNYINNGDKGKIDLPWVIFNGDSTPVSMRVSETYKISPYKYEEEIRSIIYSTEKVAGIPIKVDLKALVDQIYLSPFANDKLILETKTLLTKIFDETIFQKSIILE